MPISELNYEALRSFGENIRSNYSECSKIIACLSPSFTNLIFTVNFSLPISSLLVSRPIRAWARARSIPTPVLQLPTIHHSAWVKTFMSRLCKYAEYALGSMARRVLSLTPQYAAPLPEFNRLEVKINL